MTGQIGMEPGPYYRWPYYRPYRLVHRAVRNVHYSPKTIGFGFDFSVAWRGVSWSCVAWRGVEWRSVHCCALHRLNELSISEKQNK